MQLTAVSVLDPAAPAAVAAAGSTVPEQQQQQYVCQREAWRSLSVLEIPVQLL